MSTSDSAGAAVPLKRWRWYKLFIVIILVGVAPISWSSRLIGPIDFRYDASTYFILGTSLAEGKGYRLLNEPGEIEATQYPPLLPLVIAAHEWVLGSRDVIVIGHALRITFFLIYIAFTLAVYFLLKKHLPVLYAFFGALITILSLYTYLMSNQLAPEILFGLTTTLFFLVDGPVNRRFSFPSLCSGDCLVCLANHRRGTLRGLDRGGSA